MIICLCPLANVIIKNPTDINFKQKVKENFAFTVKQLYIIKVAVVKKLDKIIVELCGSQF